MSLSPTGLVFPLKGDVWMETCTQGAPHAKMRFRGWGDVSTSHGTAKLASKAPETGGEAWSRLSRTALVTKPAATLISSDFLPSQESDNKFCCLRHPVCGSRK